ncbi:MAG: biosynthetic-type acetolactate synthase large subunit [Clostridia bacterium]|nr:biosynthetic-type acetolactate synthase large subunit [Clostridia bacterium]
MITGAEALIKALIREGTTKIFGYPGGAVLSLYDQLAKSPIDHILMRNEQSAVHAASGYARVTGQAGVCLSTSGPGATNLVTGLATAYMDSIPLVAVSGQVSTGMIGTDAFQEVDITGITMPMTKHNYLVKDVKDIPRIVKEAFHIAITGRPGPVLIDIPRNVADALVEDSYPEEVNLRGYKPTYRGHPAQIKSLARWIKECNKPLLYAGGGVISSQASAELVQLAELIQAPVTTTLMGLGAIPASHSLNAGMLGLHGLPSANLAVVNCDLLIGIGVRFDDRVTGAVNKFAPNARIVHLDIDPAEIGKNVRVDLPIVGDVKNILEELLKQLEPAEHSQWLAQIDDWKKQYALELKSAAMVRPQQVIDALSRLIAGQGTVTSDVGQHQMWTAQYFRFERPGSFLCSGGLGTMGYGFPAAIGAQMGKPNETVVCITGDGGFQMNMAELGTAVEQKLPIKIVVLNNNTLGLVKQLQHFYCDKNYTAVCFSGNPDFVKLAQAYEGAVGLRIEGEEEIEPVLKEALSNGKLTVIDCRVSNEELVYPMVLAGAGLGEMVINPLGEEQKNE